MRESGIQRKSADVWSFGLLLSFIASDGKNKGSQVIVMTKADVIDAESS